MRSSETYFSTSLMLPVQTFIKEMKPVVTHKSEFEYSQEKNWSELSWVFGIPRLCYKE